MDDDTRNGLDMLIEGALKDFVSKETPPDGVWTNIRLRVLGRRRQPRSRPAYLRHLGAEVMAWGSDIGATVQIMLRSFYVISNGEGWTERLLLSGHSTVPLHYSIYH